MKLCIIKPPFQTHFTVETNCQRLLTALMLNHGEYLSVAKEKCINHIKALWKDGRYYISYFDQNSEEESAIEAIDRIMFKNTTFDNTILALHGAAVEWNEKAYLFLASTTSGKTTLASYLTSCGFGYITDDCILLARESFNVYPYHTPVHLREGGLKVLKKLNAAPKHLELLDDGFIKRYVYLPQNCINQPLSLGKIFFINRTENENRLLPLDTTTRMTNLMHSPITVYSITSEYLKCISALSKTACFGLHYCDMNFVAEVIRNG